MKKLLFLVMLTSMFGTAHATRSRMNSLGQDPNQGSFYLMDNRNFFRNPANAAKMRNFMVAELESNYANVDGNVEGGYFGEFNSDMAYGVYLGKRNVLIDGAVQAATTSDYLSSQDANPLNLFLGGGSDMKWGINLGFAMTDKDVAGGTQKYDSLGLSAGIETSGGLQVYASYQSAKTEGNSTPTFSGSKIESAPWTVGVIYGLNAETTLFAQYTTGKTELTSGGTTSDTDSTGMILGIGRIYELSPTARFNFDLSYVNNEVDPPGASKVKESALPLTIGLEADAAEWLILRASVKQNFILGEYKDEATGLADSTTGALSGTKVALGATFHFGKLKIDGNLGGLGGADSTNLFNATQMFVNAAATYMF